jgi:hypothetical protein
MTHGGVEEYFHTFLILEMEVSHYAPVTSLLQKELEVHIA